jgi:hypothetical protein
VSLTPCGCSRSLAVLGALFASLAACRLAAESACVERGGRVNDAVWACDLASGAGVSLWTLVSPGTLALAIAAVGVPVLVAVNVLGRRFIAACGLPMD